MKNATAQPSHHNTPACARATPSHIQPPHTVSHLAHAQVSGWRSTQQESAKFGIFVIAPRAWFAGVCWLDPGAAAARAAPSHAPPASPAAWCVSMWPSQAARLPAPSESCSIVNKHGDQSHPLRGIRTRRARHQQRGSTVLTLTATLLVHPHCNSARKSPCRPQMG